MEENKKEIRIDIRAKEIVKKDGTKFYGYKGLTKKGWYDLRFTKDVDNLPTKSCVIYVPKENANINFNGAFPVIWVSSVVKVEEYQNKLNTEDYFD